MANTRALDAAGFGSVVRKTPLVSIDLIIRNEVGQILLGYRRNRPAQNCWFVPGGRVRKNESLDDACGRVSQSEVGLTLSRKNGEFLGVHEHFYVDGFLSEEAEADTSTHYIVLAYLFLVSRKNFVPCCDDQHHELLWWDTTLMQCTDSVHSYTRAYIEELPALRVS